MRIINIIVATLMFTFFTNLKAEMTYGFSIIGGQTEISGTETEGTAADTSNRSKTIKEIFYGGDIYAEYTSGSGVTYGLSVVPLDLEVGDGSRTDSSSGADVASEADTGTRTASAELSNLLTAYANIPMGCIPFTVFSSPSTNFDEGRDIGIRCLLGIGFSCGISKASREYNHEGQHQGIDVLRIRHAMLQDASST